jgi:hypothetical protein
MRVAIRYARVSVNDPQMNADEFESARLGGLAYIPSVFICVHLRIEKSQPPLLYDVWIIGLPFP